MANLIFDQTGGLADVQQSRVDAAFFNGVQIPFISGTQVQRYAAVIYSEASFLGLARQINPANPQREMERECMGIAISMYNYARAKGAAFQRSGKFYGLADLLVDANYTKGINSPGFNEYFGVGGDDNKRRLATLSVIRLFTRQFGHLQGLVTELNGAQYWDGNDLFRRYRDHFRAKHGFELSNSAHGRLYQNVTIIQGAQVIQTIEAQDANVRSRRQFTFRSTVTAGGTIFFRLHPQATAQGVTW
jgi:hypothetical protein